MNLVDLQKNMDNTNILCFKYFSFEATIRTFEKLTKIYNFGWILPQIHYLAEDINCVTIERINHIFKNLMLIPPNLFNSNTSVTIKHCFLLLLPFDLKELSPLCLLCNYFQESQVGRVFLFLGGQKNVSPLDRQTDRQNGISKN